MAFKIIVVITLLITLLFSSQFNLVLAQGVDSITPAPTETLEARIEKVLEEKEIEIFDPSTGLGTGKKQPYQKLELLITKGSLKDKTITIENGNIPSANIPKYKAGDEVMVNFTKDIEGKDFFIISDYIRRSPLLWLFIIFVVLTIIIGKKRGLSSLVGMGLSFLVIFAFILPRISSGSDPILIAILGSLLIVPISFYLSHGFNKKTTLAIVGTLISLTITGLLASVFMEASKLTGFITEEAGFLQVMKAGAINIKGLLLAGIIIGVLGVLDDVTVSQAAIVQQLKGANDKLKAGELYKRAMDVGKDHIASMVNTLILVYTGAALPLLLIFIDNPRPFTEVINHEMLASEIIRTLVGSIGLVLAVPITTFLACIAYEKAKE